MARVGVIGVGTMGAGIAQVAAQRGWDVLLADVGVDVAQQAIDGIAKRFERLVEKGKLTADDAGAAKQRLHAVAGPHELRDCALVVEAIVEKIDVKVNVLSKAAAVAGDGAILASNTSSLSISKIGEGVGRPTQTVGMHFFNPVPLLPLVEVIAGQQTDPAAADRVAEVARAWGKTPVRCKDTPGFIVNRVARGYYLESLRMLGEGVGRVDEIDHVLKTMSGFRMGPFELMDLVGIDVNYTVSCSVYEQLDRPARLKPHPLQQAAFERGDFGQKTGRGMYDYRRGAAPVPAVMTDARSFALPEGLREAVRRFCERAGAPSGSQTEQYIFARVLGAIINEAALALDDEIATGADIDTAMKLGTNYPRGPVEWAESIGRPTCRDLLDELNRVVDDGRYAPAAWLRT